MRGLGVGMGEKKTELISHQAYLLYLLKRELKKSVKQYKSN